MKAEVIGLRIRASCDGSHGLESFYLSAAELAKQIQVTNMYTFKHCYVGISLELL